MFFIFGVFFFVDDSSNEKKPLVKPLGGFFDEGGHQSGHSPK
jgi:hypothetical protein